MMVDIEVTVESLFPAVGRGNYFCSSRSIDSACFPFQGAFVGSTLSMAFSLWLAVGTFIAKPHWMTLQTSIAGCNATPNIYSDIFQNISAEIFDLVRNYSTVTAYNRSLEYRYDTTVQYLDSWNTTSMSEMLCNIPSPALSPPMYVFESMIFSF